MDDVITSDVRIVADGEFGECVAEHLRTLLATDPTAPVPCGRVGIRASWRDVPAEFAAFGKAMYPAAWLPIASAHPYIRVGPLFMAGRAPCPVCYTARTRQHQGREDDEVARRLTAEPGLGVRGFPPHQSMIAAGLALRLLRREETGLMAAIDCRTDEVVWFRVVPAEQCPGCGEARR